MKRSLRIALTWTWIRRSNYSHEIQRDIIDAHVIVSGYMVPYVRYGHWRWLKLPEKPMNRMTEALFSGGIIGDGTYWTRQRREERNPESDEVG